MVASGLFIKVALAAASSILSFCDVHGGSSELLLFSIRRTSPSISAPNTPVYADECVRNTDCPVGKFCESDPIRPNYCATPRALNQICSRDKSCDKGLFCLKPSNSKASSKSVCAPKLAQGAKCDRNSMCKKGMYCGGHPYQCRLAGGYKATCRQSRPETCNAEQGLLCAYLTYSANRGGYSNCIRRKKYGERCTSADACENGVCTNPGDVFAGICETELRIGEICTANYQCGMQLHLSANSNRPVCNFRRGHGLKKSRFGICVFEIMLITKLGHHCDPKLDRCDAARGMECAQHQGKFVCMQFSQAGERCTPRSPLSTCLGPSSGPDKLECRRELRKITKKPFSSNKCLRKLETVRTGEICSRSEFAVCESGSVCTESKLAKDHSAYPPMPLAYCMKILPLGSACKAESLDQTCGEGSLCINNKCTTSTTGAPEKPSQTKFAGFQEYCTKKPCTPSLVCTDLGYGRRCEFPAVQKDLGQPCANTAVRRVVCKQGLRCARGLRSVSRCAAMGKIGSRCYSDSECGKGLKCGPYLPPYLRPDRYFYKKYCFDPRNSLKTGDPCNPRATFNERSCFGGSGYYSLGGIDGKYPSPDYETRFPLKCLPKGKSFACQVESSIFMSCSTSDQCQDGLRCHSKGYCIPINH